ncbi:VanZ family protein [Streptomyces goshikiensis]|uniref:VanZ family protein n=1 Tax=Streptomyces goshikiensis TaxID=1942 RepID=UPI0036CE7358
MTQRHARWRDEKSEEAVVPVPGRRGHPVSPLVRALAMVAAFAGTALFSLVLARLTLEPSAASVDLIHSNVRPGHSIDAYLHGTSTFEAVRQLGGNLLLGLPFGVLLPVLLPPARGLVRVAVVTLCLMTLVELIQGALVTGRVFDIDDVILNTTGALLGYLLLGRRLGRAVHPRRHHWWHRWTRREVAGGPEAGTVPGPRPQPETVREPQRGPDLGPETKPEPRTAPEPQRKPEPGPEAKPKRKWRAGPEAKPKWMPGSERAPKPGRDPGTDQGPGPRPDTDPGPARAPWAGIRLGRRDPR